MRLPYRSEHESRRGRAILTRNDACKNGSRTLIEAPAVLLVGLGRVTRLLRFLADLRESGNAYYAVRKCGLMRTGQAVSGAGMTPRLRADCEIDLITLVDPAKK